MDARNSTPINCPPNYLYSEVRVFQKTTYVLFRCHNSRCWCNLTTGTPVQTSLRNCKQRSKRLSRSKLVPSDCDAYRTETANSGC